MTDETELETLKVDLEIANAKADLAIKLFKGLFRDLYRSELTTLTLDSLASIGPTEEAEEADPAAAFALIAIKSTDPEDPFDREGRQMKETIRLRKLILKNLRHDQNRT